MGYQRRVHGKTHKISPSPSSSLHSPHTSYKMTPRVIVVGGGLSGLSAAHTIYLAGGNVVVLDKQGFFGGNPTKATSGINGALTRTQVDSKIQDSVKQFYDDTLKSARDKARPDLIKVLTYKSAAAVEWLQDVFNLDLTLVSRLGGHSQPRTHRGHDAKFPGMAITYALMQRLEELAENEPERAQIIKKARVTGLNKDGNKVLGVSYEFGGETDTIEGPVVWQLVDTLPISQRPPFSRNGDQIPSTLHLPTVFTPLVMDRRWSWLLAVMELIWTRSRYILPVLLTPRTLARSGSFWPLRPFVVREVFS